ncbi:DUF2268 domain-containing putative Zn-dependent protease [Lentiprolixibacter aurantiacus]|uniref:DUF2268 domain-containing putative Zn-dependent protease n=1 Tax=Lentiprolixibacter aurantiacus TaxID=2993939 RepID=A0AAE3MIJ6_9FLAO|nr:DUF2268 domain-containing putative Zn-dependent protease [Lentiprolixibacter aurantiacus]MCX2718450.1 DUF2268 domain-containing putative Zn-dependent protease [Lentiprolixibacter aurantiacus]
MKPFLSSSPRVLSLIGLFVFMCFKLSAQPNYPRTPQEAKLVSTDLAHFVEAYEALATNTDTLEVLQTLYFDRGTPGLKEFINRHQLTPELMRDAMRDAPERYALLPEFMANISQVEALYPELMQDFGKVLPAAMYPPTYLLVGANRGIGQASLQGQLITVTRVADKLPVLRKLIVHELSHFQQAMTMGGQQYAALYSTPDNMLGLCLREGGAEFITSLVVADITQKSALEYLEKEEKQLKERFVEDLKSQSKDYWLWGSLEQPDQPKLLGYVMGYKICEAYYKGAGDKATALQDILKMDNARSFLEKSHYFDSN